MHTPRPVLALYALALSGLGYGTPWVLSMLHEPPQVPKARISPAGSERVVRLVFLPEPVADEGPEVLAESTPETRQREIRTPAGEPEPLVRVGQAPDAVRRIPVGLLVREIHGDLHVPPTKKRRRGRKGKRRKRPCEPDRSEIARVSDRGYRVEDSLVAYYAEHPRESEGLATTWWNKDEAGERDGFRVGRIRCGTLLHQLGLRSGDAVMAINGTRIQSYADGLTAYLRVRHKQLIWVEVVRKGEPLRLDFLLVEDGTAEVAQPDEALGPSTLVDQELALGELTWLKRRKGRRAQRSRLRQAEASTRNLGLPGMRELSELGDLPED